LSRKYAYQVLLAEEFSRCGVLAGAHRLFARLIRTECSNLAPATVVGAALATRRCLRSHFKVRSTISRRHGAKFAVLHDSTWPRCLQPSALIAGSTSRGVR
jgi:hypothetical protein